MTDKIREAFEKWATDRGLSITRYHLSSIVAGEYINQQVYWAWKGYQAATSHAAPDAVVKALEFYNREWELQPFAPAIKECLVPSNALREDRGKIAEQALASLSFNNNLTTGASGDSGDGHKGRFESASPTSLPAQPDTMLADIKMLRKSLNSVADACGSVSFGSYSQMYGAIKECQELSENTLEQTAKYEEA